MSSLYSILRLQTQNDIYTDYSRDSLRIHVLFSLSVCVFWGSREVNKCRAPIQNITFQQFHIESKAKVFADLRYVLLFWFQC